MSNTFEFFGFTVDQIYRVHYEGALCWIILTAFSKPQKVVAGVFVFQYYFTISSAFEVAYNSASRLSLIFPKNTLGRLHISLPSSLWEMMHSSVSAYLPLVLALG